MTATVKKFFSIILLTLMLLSFASAEFIVQTTTAEEPSFSTFSSASVSLCECASTTDYVVITNHNSYSQTFRLSSDNELISLPGGDIAVSAGQSLSVPYQVSAPCNQQSYEIDIFVDGVAQTKKITKDVQVNQCQNLKVEVFEPELGVGICQGFLSSFRIENTGPYTETYEVDANHFTDYVSVSNQQVTIPANSFADIAFSYQFSCDMDDVYYLSYDVYSQKSDVKAQVSQKIVISDTYKYNVSISQPDNMCLGDQSYFEITIENNNEFTDFYTIDVDAPGFVDVQYPLLDGEEAKTIVLNPHSKTSLGVFVTPSKNRDLGTKAVSVSVYSKYAQTSQVASTTFEVYDCYSFDNFFTVVPGTLSTCGGESFAESVQLTHEGFGSPVVELSSSSELVSFENSLVEFDGQETKNVSLLVEVPRNLTSRNTVTLYATFRNNTVDQASFTLLTDTVENCYMLAPVKDEIKIYDQSEYFTVPIQNVGERTSLFSAEILQAPAYVNLLSSEFEVASGRRTKLLFEIDRDILIEDALLYNNGSVIGLMGSMDLEMSHDNPNVSFTNSVNLEFIDYPWYFKLWNEIKQTNNCTKVFFVLVILMLLFGIIGIIKTVHHNYFRANIVLGLICLAVFIIAAIVLLVKSGIPTSMYSSYDTTSNSTTHIKMLEDEVKEIDLTSFFYDPDNNLVEYGVAFYEPAVMNFTVDDSIVRLIPKEDWNGNTTIGLYVVDNYNASAVSPDILVEVYSVEDFTVKEIFDYYCCYINLAVLFLLLLVIFISFSFHKKEKEQQLTIQEAEKTSKKQDEAPKKIDSSKKVAKKTSAKKKTTKKKSSKSTHTKSKKKATKKPRKSSSKK